MSVNPEDDDDPNPVLAGKVEAEFDLMLKEAAAADPAGKKREEPHPLVKPNRPNDSMFQLMGPLTMLRYLFFIYFSAFCNLFVQIIARENYGNTQFFNEKFEYHMALKVYYICSIFCQKVS